MPRKQPYSQFFEKPIFFIPNKRIKTPETKISGVFQK